MLFKDVINEILSVIIAIRKDISRKNADPLNDNRNQYLKEHRYKKSFNKTISIITRKKITKKH